MIPFSRWLLPAVLVVPAAAQITEVIDVNMRVTSVEPRTAIVDHGAVDGLAVGDRVQFRTRENRLFEGSIVRVDDRSAAVELDDPAFSPAPGTRASARIPRARVAAPAPVPAPPEAVTPTTEPTQPPEHPPWGREADDWTPEQPLLARIRPFHPEDRQPRSYGRVYTIADYLSNTEGHRRDTFARVGADLTYENLFRKGGTLHVDGELNDRRTVVPDDDDQSLTKLRVDRLSYSIGGDRFSPNRWELGRFLQHEMPEFGVLDGVEWGRRLRDGDTFAASVGLMPEPDRDQEDGDDLQLAASYRFVVDESELLTVQGGYQKTFHQLAADRDLFVAKLTCLPPYDWTFGATAWIDWYTAGDDAKSSGPEITQAYVTTGRRFDDGSSLRATYTHLAFPQLDRDEFLPVTAEQLADDHSDRASLSGKLVLGSAFALFGRVGAWADQDDEGGDAEGGFEIRNFLFDGSVADAAAFGSDGRFSSTVGWRASMSVPTSHGSWRAGYEFALNRVDGFSSGNDDLPQHRITAAFESFGDSGWSLSAHADVLLFDSESALLAGLFLQRSF